MSYCSCQIAALLFYPPVSIPLTPLYLSTRNTPTLTPPKFPTTVTPHPNFLPLSPPTQIPHHCHPPPKSPTTVTPHPAVVDIFSHYENDVLEGAKNVVAEAYRLWLTYDDRTDDISIIVLALDNYEAKSPDPKSRRSRTGSFIELLASAHQFVDSKPVRRAMTKAKRALISEQWELDDMNDMELVPIVKTTGELARIGTMVQSNVMFQSLDAQQKEQVRGRGEGERGWEKHGGKVNGIRTCFTLLVISHHFRTFTHTHPPTTVTPPNYHCHTHSLTYHCHPHSLTYHCHPHSNPLPLSPPLKSPTTVTPRCFNTCTSERSTRVTLS